MKWIVSLSGLLFGMAVLAVLARLLGLDEIVRQVIASGHLPDVVMGVLCLIWLLVILKAPWDLYFQACAVSFDQQRSAERRIALLPGRAEYIRRLRLRLGGLAVAAHVGSAALVAAVATFTGDRAVGYWFAVFYLVSTLFRPTIAGYVYLSRKLTAVAGETRYPIDDVMEMRRRVDTLDQNLRTLQTRFDELRERTAAEMVVHSAETRELRERQSALAREFEAAASRLTDNKEVIQGIQAFVRLITQASRVAAS